MGGLTNQAERFYNVTLCAWEGFFFGGCGNVFPFDPWKRRRKDSSYMRLPHRMICFLVGKFDIGCSIS